MKTKNHHLASYWTGIQDALHGRLLSVQEYLRHPSSGVNAENYFRHLLVEYLPRRYSVESGFVVNVEGERSDFIDVLIVDSLNIAALSAEPHFKVFPAEAVVGAIEITSATKGTVKRTGFAKNIGKLRDDILKLAKLRGIARQREYLEPAPVSTSGSSKLEDRRLAYELSPRSFLITCGDEWVKPESYEKHLTESLSFAAQSSRPFGSMLR